MTRAYPAHYPYSMTAHAVVVILLLVSAMMAFLIASKAFTKTDVLAANWFALLMVASAVYSITYAMELTGTQETSMLFWVKAEYLPTVTIPIFWLMFAGSYTGTFKATASLFGMMMIIPVVTLIIVFTSHMHPLFYVRTWYDYASGFPVFRSVRGPWYWIWVGYMWSMTATGIVIIFRHSILTKTAAKAQAIVVSGASLFLLACNALYFLGLTPYGLEISPIAFVIAGMFFYYAITRLSLLDFIPIAREQVFSAMTEGALILDNSYELLDFNETAARIFELRRKTARLSFSSLHPEIQRLKDLPGSTSETLLQFAGSERHYAVSRFPLHDRRGAVSGTALLFRDITETMETLERLNKMANTDFLTGLLNRGAFFNLLKETFEGYRQNDGPKAVFMADLDFFKAINDKWGHAAGDKVLRETSMALKKLLRSGDIVARYGGEEFAVMLQSSDRISALATAERMRSCIESLGISWEGAIIRVTISIGVYVPAPQRDETYETCLSKADEALYEAKHRNRNQVVLKP